MKNYFYSVLLGILSMELGRIWHFIPDPETAFKAGVLAILTGCLAEIGRQLVRWLKHKLFTKPKP